MNESAAAAPRTDRRLPMLVAGLVIAVAWWAASPYAVGVFHDDGVYVILAKSIATGQGYRFLHLPGAPAATHYPPLYPLLLAALWRLAPNFPANVSLFLLANAVLLGATAFGVQRFAERVVGWPRPAAVAAALVATLSAPLLMLSGLVLSEPLFAAALFPALFAAERIARSDVGTRRTILLSIGIGALALVRTHGIALAVGLVVVLLVRGRRRSALVCAAAVLATLAPWELWLALHRDALPDALRGSYGPYAAWLTGGLRGGAIGFVPRTMFINAREVGALLADHFALTDGAAPRFAATILAAAAIAVGAWRLSTCAPALVAFTVVYGLVLLAWPYTPWRFVYAVWPIVVLCVGAAIEVASGAMVRAAIKRRALGITAVLAPLAALVLVAGAAREEGRAYAERAWARPAAMATAQIAPLVQWVRASTRPGDLVAVDGEQLVYLFTGRHAVPLAPFTAAEYVRPRTVEDNALSLRQLLAEFPVRYVLTIQPALRASTELLVASNADAADTRPRGSQLVRVAPLAAGEVYRVEPR